MQTVYLIQHVANGYVHLVFSNLPAARLWIRLYNSKTSTPGDYCIIDRQVHNITSGEVF